MTTTALQASKKTTKKKIATPKAKCFHIKESLSMYTHTCNLMCTHACSCFHFSVYKVESHAFKKLLNFKTTAETNFVSLRDICLVGRVNLKKKQASVYSWEFFQLIRRCIWRTTSKDSYFPLVIPGAILIQLEQQLEFHQTRLLFTFSCLHFI